MKTKLFITGLAVMALTALASAQNNGVDKNQQNTSGKCLAFVDANKNGICDNYEYRMTTVPVGDKNGNCRCCVQGNQRGQGMGRGMGPVNGMWPGQKQGNGMGQGQGRNRNFVDADKNGVCDYFEAASKK